MAGGNKEGKKMLKRTYRRGPDKQISGRVLTKNKKKRDCMMCYNKFFK